MGRQTEYMTTIDAQLRSVAVERRAPVRPPGPNEAALRRHELGAFLRNRRERLAPADVGLPAGGRRRTPGLRREEVASLAGVGMTWYTWLEQGRDINASEQVLDAIARTLMLDAHERTHLFTLAGLTPPGPVADLKCVSPEVLAVLEQVNPYPAFVTNARFDLLAYNHGYLALIGDIDALPIEERNSVWVVFTKETTSRCFVDRDHAKPRMVAQLRAGMADHIADPAFKCLVRRLQEASPEFRELWARHDVAEPENARKRILHRDLGLLQFNFLNTWLAPRAGLRLVTYIPGDDPTREAVTEFDAMTPAQIV
jgi:transcriptional regulator with XRE-family HTH domain